MPVILYLTTQMYSIGRRRRTLSLLQKNENNLGHGGSAGMKSVELNSQLLFALKTGARSNYFRKYLVLFKARLR